MSAQEEPSSKPSKSSWGYGVLLAVPLLALSAVPWLSAAPGETRVASLGFVLLTAACVWMSRPRLTPIAPMPAPRGASAAVFLTHCYSGDGRGDAHYAAEIVDTGARTLLARGEDPARVLDSALRHAERSGTKVLPGWGLTREDVQVLGAASAPRRPAPRLPPMEVSELRFAGARAATATMLAVALVVLVVTLLGGVLVREKEISSTSWLLAATAVALPFVMMGFTATRTTLTVADSRIVVSRSRFGRRSVELSFAADEVLHLCAVAPSGRFHKHLLLRTAFGLASVPCANALQLVRTVHEGWKHMDNRQ